MEGQNEKKGRQGLVAKQNPKRGGGTSKKRGAKRNGKGESLQNGRLV